MDELSAGAARVTARSVQRVRYSRAVPSQATRCAAVAAAALLTLTTACSGGSGGGASLRAALGRVADTSGNRSQIWYDNTAQLVRLAGSDWISQKGFAPLRAMGAGDLSTAEPQLTTVTGINPISENYAILVDAPPRDLGLIAGGQDAGTVTSDLTRLGWTHNGGRLVGPSPVTMKNAAANAIFALDMAQVTASGSDISYGSAHADLSQIGHPRGQTLASDPVISSLASCLGNVVTARISTYNQAGLRPAPSEVAVGVLTPASNSATPRAVVCASWPSAAAASSYERNLKAALATGMSFSRGVRYSSLLTHASVRSVGGPQHVVAWQAGTPGNALLVIEMAQSLDLPALPDCQRLPPAGQSRIVGCP